MSDRTPRRHRGRVLCSVLCLLGLSFSVTLWGLSFWNWEHQRGNTLLALWGGALIHLEDYKVRRAPGLNCVGWDQWTPTYWWFEHREWESNAWTALPLWIPALLFAGACLALNAPAIFRRYRREQEGRCVRCATELRSPAPRCLECGSRIARHSVLQTSVLCALAAVVVLTAGLAALSYRNLSWWSGSVEVTLAAGTWTTAYDQLPALRKRTAGFQGWTTRWIPAAKAVGLGSSVTVPLWPVAGLITGLALCVHLLPTLRRRRRKMRGQCLRCGYDLRGSTRRCPECGMEIEKPAADAGDPPVTPPATDS